MRSPTHSSSSTTEAAGVFLTPPIHYAANGKVDKTNKPTMEQLQIENSNEISSFSLNFCEKYSWIISLSFLNKNSRNDAKFRET